MIVAVTGTGTGVGKTVVSAAMCAVALGTGRRVAYLKAAQTGVPGDEPDITVVSRLAGPDVTVHEGARYPDPMSPEAAARARGLPEVSLAAVVAAAFSLAAAHDLVVIEGAGGLLVRYAADGWGLASLAAALEAPLIVVAGTQLGTLNALALTREAIAHRGLTTGGVVIGSWPLSPTALDLSNEVDMAPIVGKMPAHSGDVDASTFNDVARAAIGPAIGRLIATP